MTRSRATPEERGRSVEAALRRGPRTLARDWMYLSVLLSPRWPIWTVVELRRAWLCTIRLTAAAATSTATTAQYTRAVR